MFNFSSSKRTTIFTSKKNSINIHTSPNHSNLHRILQPQLSKNVYIINRHQLNPHPGPLHSRLLPDPDRNGLRLRISTNRRRATLNREIGVEVCYAFCWDDIRRAVG